MTRLKYTTATLVQKLKEKHNNIFDYSKVIYTGILNKIEIICLQNGHGPFLQKANNHLSGQGCPKCGGTQKFTREEFIKRSIEIHGNLYDYSKVIYTNNKTPVLIICPKHNEFFQNPNNHTNQKQGCPRCFGGILDTQENFLKKAEIIHGEKYNYSNIRYAGSYIKINIICNKHGPFMQDPHTHLKGHGCPTCTHIVSKKETAWLDELGIDNRIRNKTIKINDKLFKLDALDEDNKVVWEFLGDYWHGNPNKYNQNKINAHNKKAFGELYNETLYKLKFLEDAGYKVIYIWESDFKEAK